jgi:hypothetical protein
MTKGTKSAEAELGALAVDAFFYGFPLHDRYYLLQFVDAWTNNFAYVRHRATGTEAGSFLLVARDWDGQAPSGARVVRFPTDVATILGRWAVNGEADLANVAELQERLTLAPTAAGSSEHEQVSEMLISETS